MSPQQQSLPRVIRSYFIKVQHIFPLPKETYRSSCWPLGVTTFVHAESMQQYPLSMAHSRGQNKHCTLIAKNSATLALFFSFFFKMGNFITAPIFAIGSDRRRHRHRHTHAYVYVYILYISISKYT